MHRATQRCGPRASSSSWPACTRPIAFRVRNSTAASDTRLRDMTKRNPLGGVIHTYQKYDPQKFPSPTQPPPDMVSPAFEHMLAYGDMRERTDEELARAVHL